MSLRNQLSIKLTREENELLTEFTALIIKRCETVSAFYQRHYVQEGSLYFPPFIHVSNFFPTFPVTQLDGLYLISELYRSTQYPDGTSIYSPLPSLILFTAVISEIEEEKLKEKGDIESFRYKHKDSFRNEEEYEILSTSIDQLYWLYRVNKLLPSLKRK